MSIYYLLLEGRPLPSNAESNEFAGAYISCWIDAKNEGSARMRAIRHIHDEEDWQTINIEEIYIADRRRYMEESDSLACFDQAIESGIGVIFYTWPIGGDDEP